MKLKILPLLFSLIIINGCNKEAEQPNLDEIEYIVFGHFYGFCAGEECVEIFKLTADELFEDTSDTYPRWDRYYQGDFVRLDQSKFDLAISLKNEIPDQLLSAPDTIFGSPDASDRGGIYFAMRTDDYYRFWVMDQVDHNIPTYLQPFKNKINETIGLIND